MKLNAKQWISPQIQAMNAYHVAQEDFSACLKLDAMELPCDMPVHLKVQWAEMIGKVALNRYPLPHNKNLAEQLRRQFTIPSEQQIIFGNGSDEFIQIIQTAIAAPGRTVLAPAPSFVMYHLVAELSGLDFVGVDLREDFSLNMPAMLAAIAQHNPAVIFLACPNNPTGNAFSRADIEQVICAAPGLVVLDEAYFAYAQTALWDFSLRYPNVVVMRTLSKVGFAGLRFGYLFGHPAWIGEFDKVRPPYNVNVLTQASIEFVLHHYAEIAAQITGIIAEREKLIARLMQLSQCQVWPSQANFVLLRCPDAEQVFLALQEKKILVKNLHGSHPLLENCLRLTVSNPQENQQLLAALLPLLEK